MTSNDLPKVSVMIPTFKQDGLIARSVESALRQDYTNLEIIVADDCSPDETREVVGQYLSDKRLLYFRNETNLGRVANYRKTLYEKANGTWALNLDGDDQFYANDAVSHMVSEIARHKGRNPVAVVGSYLAVNGENGSGSQPFKNYQTGIFSGLDVFLNWDRLSFGHLSTLYKADVARAIDYYRLNIISSDWESILRLLLHGDVIVTDKIIGVWNIHGNNATVTKSMAEGISDYRYIEETYKYACTKGIDTKLLDGWFRRMVKFHTKVLWVSSARSSQKFRLLLPHVFRTYPFALAVLSSPKTAVKMALGISPFLYTKMRAFCRSFGLR